MTTVISLSLETDILNNFLVISFSMLFCLSSLQSKEKEELGIFFSYLGFPLNQLGIFLVFISVNIGMISISLINPLALLMCNFSSLHTVNTDF